MDSLVNHDKFLGDKQTNKQTNKQTHTHTDISFCKRQYIET